MAEHRPLAGIWDRAYQVGIVVKNMDRAVAFYEGLGIGPFIEGPSAHAIDRRIYGRLEPDAEVKGRIAQIGSIEFELMQPVRGKSIQSEFLEKHGEGIVHICAYTDDLDAAVERMAAQGFAVISSAEFDDGGKFAYFETREVGGLVLELFQPGTNWS